MALHPEFPASPYEPLVPEHRWFPARQTEGRPSYRFVYVDQASFEQHKPGNFAALASSFTEYQA